jgi:hypothetical protein
MRALLIVALLAMATPAFACSGNHEASISSPTTTATTSTPDTPPPAPSSGG